MKSIRLKIIDLLDQHTDLYNCKGCDICREVERLGKLFVRDPAEKERCKTVLSKGKDMTKSDIQFLLETEVDRRTICKALKMNQTEFALLMRNWGFTRKPKEEEELAKLTVEEYRDYKAKGLSDKQIAERKEMKPNSLSQWKWINKSKLSESTTKIEMATPKIEIEKLETPRTDVNAELRQLNNDLVDENKILSTRVLELQTKVQELENLNAACNDVENECNSLHEELEQERKAKVYFQSEYDRVQTALEQKDYELTGVLNKQADIYSGLLRLEKENKALKELVKLYVER